MNVVEYLMHPDNAYSPLDRIESFLDEGFCISLCPRGYSITHYGHTIANCGDPSDSPPINQAERISYAKNYKHVVERCEKFKVMNKELFI